jgi:hypothetical protein
LEVRSLLTTAGAPTSVFVNAAWAGSLQGQIVTDTYGSHTFGVNAFAAVQSGVNAVASGGTLYNDAGTYNESVTIGKPLTWIGNKHDVPGTSSTRTPNSSSESVINGGSSPAVTLLSGGVILNGLDLNGASGVNALFSSTGGGVTLQDNIVGTAGPDVTIAPSGNVAVTANALTSSAGSAIQIQPSAITPDVSIQNNAISGTGGGIVMSASTGGFTLGNVSITGNTISGGISGSISLSASAGTLSLGNLIVDNNSAAGGITVSALQTQMNALDLSGNTLGANVNLSTTGTDPSGDLVIGGAVPPPGGAITISGNSTVSVSQSQTITVSAGRDLQVSGNTTVTVNQNETITVQANRDITVGNNQSVTVSGNKDETVGKGGTITISGNRDVTIGGNTTVNDNRNETITISGSRTTTVSSGETITVNGNRTETVGKNQTITVGAAQGNLTLGNVTVSNNALNSVSGNTLAISAGGSILGGTIQILGNTIGGTGGGDGVFISGGGTASQPVLISGNQFSGPADSLSSSIGVDVSQSVSDTAFVAISGNTIDGFGTGVRMLNSGTGTLNNTIGGAAASDSNTIQNCRTAILASGLGTFSTVSNNSDPIYMNYEGLKGESNANVHSDHNKWIEVNSYQFGIGRGITSTSGASVSSDHDTISLQPGIPDNAGIYVDGGSFHGINDLIDGGGSAASPSLAVGLRVTSAISSPPQSVSINFTKSEHSGHPIVNDNPGIQVDASADYWGTNLESSIANTIGGAGAAEVDYTPWLDSGTNLIPLGSGGKVNPGFEGDFSSLDVGLGGAQSQPVGRITEASVLVTAGGVVRIASGIYNENFNVKKNMTLKGAGTSGPAGAQTIINGSISIQDGADLGLQFASAPLQIFGLSIASTGTLDLTNSTLLINYPAGGDPVETIRSYLTSGYNNGAWNGFLINSSIAASGPAGTFGVGYADSADGVVLGQPPNSIELRYTVMGDTNLDQIVNSTDAIQMTRNYLIAGRTAWDQGNFNYDSTINLTDAQILQKNYNVAITTASIASGTSSPPSVVTPIPPAPPPAPPTSTSGHSSDLTLLPASEKNAKWRQRESSRKHH